MREFDEEGLMLSNAQASLFYDSVSLFEGSSKVFIRSFMNSSGCAFIDRYQVFDRAAIIRELSEKYDLKRGKKKYAPEVMNWIGYLYRYWSYAYELPSKQIYKMISPEELSNLYYPYHSLDPNAAIKRIYEAKNINKNKDALEIMKRIYSL